MKIAITGANGFVGSTLIRSLQSQDFEPVALLRRAVDIPDTEVRVIDFSKQAEIITALSDIDVLIHNAGMTKALSAKDMLSANVGLTRQLIEAVNHLKQDIRFFYISSQAASGPSGKDLPKSEADSLHPLTTYGKSKAIAERIIRRDCRKDYCIIRPSSVYGPGDRDFLELFKLCYRGFSLHIGKSHRPLNMIYSEELADFITTAIINPKSKNEIFFATDTYVYSHHEIVKAISEAMGKKNLAITIPETIAKGIFSISDFWARITRRPSILNLEKFKEITADAWTADPSKAKELLGWQPESKLKQQMRETFQWYKENHWL
jgi:nucleoside-diphosphate-sugar epimerase